jgi:serine/threonine-protein kinase RsbW
MLGLNTDQPGHTMTSQLETGDRVVESGRSALDDGADRDCSAVGPDEAVFSQTYPAVAKSVPVIRAMVAQFATQAGLGAACVAAAKLAVSEAATNVVVHAYADTDRPGLIEVETTHEAGELRVSVADTGPGLRAGAGRPGLGLGLVIIQELADHVELLQGGRHGLRVVMRFTAPAQMPDPGRD